MNVKKHVGTKTKTSNTVFKGRHDDDDDDDGAGMVASLNACNVCKQLFIGIAMRIKFSNYVGVMFWNEGYILLLSTINIDSANSQLYVRQSSE